jgi:hypothetical protein
MIDPVGPAKRPSATRRIGARISPLDPRRAGGGSSERLALPAPNEAEPTVDDAAGAAAFAAQLLGEGQRRGLKGGQETLDRARTTYLETEWSGHADRRISRGRITKADV